MKLEDGVDICRCMYLALNGHGYFPALTGGLLYKDGVRKDCDIVVYRHRQDIKHFEMVDIGPLLRSIGFSDFKYYGFVTKAKFKGFDVDLFNPECAEGEYPPSDDTGFL